MGAGKQLDDVTSWHNMSVSQYNCVVFDNVLGWYSHDICLCLRRPRWESRVLH